MWFFKKMLGYKIELDGIVVRGVFENEKEAWNVLSDRYAQARTTDRGAMFQVSMYVFTMNPFGFPQWLLVRVDLASIRTC